MRGTGGQGPSGRLTLLASPGAGEAVRTRFGQMAADGGGEERRGTDTGDVSKELSTWGHQINDKIWKETGFRRKMMSLVLNF